MVERIIQKRLLVKNLMFPLNATFEPTFVKFVKIGEILLRFDKIRENMLKFDNITLDLADI